MPRYKHPKAIKVGVIGYGGAFNMGQQHLAQMKKAGMTPFAVCELDPDRLKVAEDDFPGIETYTSLDTMLRRSDVNLLVHITPHDLHYPLAMKCVKAGKHVVTEKPFVLGTTQADKLIAAAKQNKVMVSTYHNRHWDGWIVRAVREIVEKQAIGKVFKIDAVMGGYEMPKPWWRTSKSISGGVLYDWGVHLLEYCLQVVPSTVTEVSGFAQEGFWEAQSPQDFPWRGDMNEDDATAVVRFADGTFINLSISQLRTKYEPNFLTFHGTKGSYAITWNGWTTRKPNRKGEIIEKTGKHPKSDGGKIFYQNIADHLTGKADLVITPEWARRPIHVLDLAVKSAAQNKTLKAKYG
ncbi:MAG: Gfo/Idh/MocA family oxidoreductase [Planctomycetota bacterium]